MRGFGLLSGANTEELTDLLPPTRRCWWSRIFGILLNGSLFDSFRGHLLFFFSFSALYLIGITSSSTEYGVA